MTEKERRMEVVERMCDDGTKKNLDLVHLKGRTIDECKGLVDEIKALDITDDEKIVLISIIRTSVFYIKNEGLETCVFGPSDPTVCDAWDEAADVLNGGMPLLVDVVDEDYEYRGYCDATFTHHFVNCTNGKVYDRRLPYKYWFAANDDDTCDC